MRAWGIRNVAINSYEGKEWWCHHMSKDGRWCQKYRIQQTRSFMSIGDYCSREIGQHWPQWWHLQWLAVVFCGSHTSRQHQPGVFRRQKLRGQAALVHLSGWQAAATAKCSVCSGIIVQSPFLENNRDIIYIIQSLQRNRTTIYMCVCVFLSIYFYTNMAHAVMEAEESIQALCGLSDVHSHWGGPSPPIQMLTSSGKTITDIPRSV